MKTYFLTRLGKDKLLTVSNPTLQTENMQRTAVFTCTRAQKCAKTGIFLLAIENLDIDECGIRTSIRRYDCEMKNLTENDGRSTTNLFFN